MGSDCYGGLDFPARPVADGNRCSHLTGSLEVAGYILGGLRTKKITVITPGKGGGWPGP